MDVKIIPFDEQYSKDFYTLNIEWLKTFFYVEPFDEEVLGNPQTYIIDKGGHIFFVINKDKAIGTLALMPTDEPDIFELTKMAVSPAFRGQKIGQMLMIHTIEFAKSNRFKGLLLYSNTKLENAIYIYRKYGFVEHPLEPESPYKRSDIKMILKLG
ncbi:MAG: GNAT family N-acetyltransferase [Flavobacteriaceae bacterium]|nr:GNAT family N-acetyltransferase [Bacteroidia bacterium]MBT8286487.1 GNAT family N-acetyltransferase [Bacteroidia bacterium]NNF75352.1 GNAT family N-acetyltransferase [Flavobacteriaceae bacterium]NNK73225.1 GNAT family N-acetyltransferase [Flavobacteriaceae bacterium]